MPFPSSLVPLFQNESECETFHMKMSSACSFIFMQIKVIFIRMVSHLDSLWNRGTRKLVHGLFNFMFIHTNHMQKEKFVMISNKVTMKGQYSVSQMHLILPQFFDILNFCSLTRAPLHSKIRTQTFMNQNFRKLNLFN